MTNRKFSSASVTAIAVAALSVASAQAADMETLTLVERATTDAVIDTGAAGDSSGDLLTFANDFDKDNATKVGSDSGWCIRVVAGKSWECFWTLMLADGQITIEGPFLDAGDSVMAVTGGPGNTWRPRQMALHARNDKDRNTTRLQADLLARSETRWRASGDDFAFFGAGIAEAVRQAAVEVKGVAGAEHAPLIADGHLQAAAQHDAAFLGLMAQHCLAGVGASCVALVDDLQIVAGEIATDLAIGDAPAR
jgi:hypothetical protein